MTPPAHDAAPDDTRASDAAPRSPLGREALYRTLFDTIDSVAWASGEQGRAGRAVLARALSGRRSDRRSNSRRKLRDASAPTDGVAGSALYRITQEALTNVAKHAHATDVSVILTYTDGAIQLIVEDDGQRSRGPVVNFIPLRPKVPMTSPRLVLRQGDHACMLYTTAEEQLVAATEYIRGGLSRGERCLFICVEHDVPVFREALKHAGIDADAEEQRGALVLLTKEEGHLQGGSFDPARMIHTLDVAVKNALAAGFAGLCAGGDMSWILEDPDSADKLAEYEALLNQFYRDRRALGLCLYNRRTLPPSIIDHGIATHSHIQMEGPIHLSNPFYEEPEVAAKRKARPELVEHKLAQLRPASAVV